MTFDKELKLPMWQKDWDLAEEEWKVQAQLAALTKPLRGLTSMPRMPGITKETAKRLKWKSLVWMIRNDHKKEILQGMLRHPFRYGKAFLRSALQKKPYKREGDFFLYGVDTLSDFTRQLSDETALFVLGFSYCHKPFECPSGRFTSECIHDIGNPVCQQCFIGKAVHAITPKQTIPLFIPTIHYIGGKIFEIVHENPKRAVVFVITACEMTLEMFGDWGNMVGVRGLGVRLDGRICNTMEAFALSERGIKPGLTVVLDETQKKIMEFIRFRNQIMRK